MPRYVRRIPSACQQCTAGSAAAAAESRKVAKYADIISVDCSSDSKPQKDFNLAMISCRADFSGNALLIATFLPERDYVTFGSLLSQFRLSVCRL